MVANANLHNSVDKDIPNNQNSSAIDAYKLLDHKHNAINTLIKTTK